MNNEKVKSLSTMLYARVITKPLMISTSAMVAQSASSMVMLGGFIGYSTKGEVDVFRTMNTTSAWINFL